MKVDILAFGAHPDDVDLTCAGTILKHIDKGYKAAIVDLTEGQLGTLGSAELRLKEAEHAAEILGVSARENLGFYDGFFTHDKHHLLEVIKMIRKYQPRVILANAVHDRHPDHGKAAKLVAEAAFLSGLKKIETKVNGEMQQKWRPVAVYHYIQAYSIKPDFAVDITPFMDKKMEAIYAFETQFYNPDKENGEEKDETFISTPEFIEFLYSRAREHGKHIDVIYGEGFTTNRYIGVEDIVQLG